MAPRRAGRLKIPLSDDDAGTKHEPRPPTPGPGPSSDMGLRSHGAPRRRELSPARGAGARHPGMIGVPRIRPDRTILSVAGAARRAADRLHAPRFGPPGARHGRSWAKNPQAPSRQSARGSQRALVRPGAGSRGGEHSASVAYGSLGSVLTATRSRYEPRGVGGEFRGHQWGFLLALDTFTRPRVPKNSADPGITTYVQPPLLGLFCRTAVKSWSKG